MKTLICMHFMFAFDRIIDRKLKPNNIMTNHNESSSLDETSSTSGNTNTVPCSNELFYVIMYGPFLGIICLSGLIGNSLLYYFLCKKYPANYVCAYLLKALAVVDNVFLLTSVFVQTIPALIIYRGRIDLLEPIYHYFQAIAWPIARAAQMASVWMMGILTVNRYIIVCKPYRIVHLCAKRIIRIEIIAMLVFVVLFNVPRIFDFHYVIVNVTSADNGSSGLIEELNVGLASYPLYNIMYENVAYALFVYMIPLGLISFFNFHLVRELRLKNVLTQQMSPDRAKLHSETNNSTLVLTVIIISFIVCQTPPMCNQILFYAVSEEQRSTCSAYNVFFHTSNLLITVNSSIIFFVYFIFRRNFKKDLYSLIPFLKKRKSSSKMRMSLAQVPQRGTSATDARLLSVKS